MRPVRTRHKSGPARLAREGKSWPSDARLARTCQLQRRHGVTVVEQRFYAAKACCPSTSPATMCRPVCGKWQALADAAHEDLVARIWRLDNRILELVQALATAPRPDRWPQSPYWHWWYAVRARVLRGEPPGGPQPERSAWPRGHPGVPGRRRPLGLDRLSCAVAMPARARRASRPGPGAGSPEPAGGAVPARTQRAAARPATPAPRPRRPRQPGRGPRAAGGRVSERAGGQTAPGPRGTGARRQDSAALPTSKTRCRRAARQRRAPATRQQRSPTPMRSVDDGHAAAVMLPVPSAMMQGRPPLVCDPAGHPQPWQQQPPRPGNTAPPPWLAGSISAGSQGLWPLVRGAA